MFTNLISKDLSSIPDHQFDNTIVLLTPCDQEENGVLRRTSEYKAFDIAENLSKFKSSDFDITSLAAVGALDKLKSTYMAYTSNLSVADSFEGFKLVENNEK